MAAAECGYREIDRLFKEQFSHKIIKELTTQSNEKQTTSKGVLAWAIRVEVQWVQAAILSYIVETHQFEKVKLNPKPRNNQVRQMAGMTGQRRQCMYCGGIHMPRPCPAYGKMCTGCRKNGHFRKVCQSKRDHVVHELEVEVAQEMHDAKIETVSINSVHLSRNQSLITAYLETQVGKNSIEIQYKIDTGNKASIMPFIYSKNYLKIQQMKC